MRLTDSAVMSAKVLNELSLKVHLRILIIDCNDWFNMKFSLMVQSEINYSMRSILHLVQGFLFYLYFLSSFFSLSTL